MAEWKAPMRPRTDNGVSQTYNDGLVAVYMVTDAARPGYQPVERLTKKAVLHYEERQLGLQRAYLAKQNQVDVERVLRTPRLRGVSTQDVAVTEDGRQYRIDLVQSVADVWPPSMDLTLARLEQDCGVSDSDTSGRGLPG